MPARRKRPRRAKRPQPGSARLRAENARLRAAVAALREEHTSAIAELHHRLADLAEAEAKAPPLKRGRPGAPSKEQYRLAAAEAYEQLRLHGYLLERVPYADFLRQLAEDELPSAPGGDVAGRGIVLASRALFCIEDDTEERVSALVRKLRTEDPKGWLTESVVEPDPEALDRTH